MAAKMGRPVKEINWEQLAKICAYPMRQTDIASILDMSVDTLANAIKENYGITFSEYIEQKKGKFRLTLMQKQYEVAMKGNVSMLIWLGKQYLDQNDKQQIDHKEIMDPGAKEKAKQEFRDWLKAVVSDK